jgi:hypothetical protein
MDDRDQHQQYDRHYLELAACLAGGIGTHHGGRTRYHSDASAAENAAANDKIGRIVARQASGDGNTGQTALS